MNRPLLLAIGLVGVLGACGGSACSSGSTKPADDAVWRASFAKDGAGALDGRSFAVKGGEVGKAADESETLEFHGGRFHSTGCDAYGFSTAPYTTTKSGDAIAFECETTSAKEGRVRWHGTVRGDAIDAGFTWIKDGQKPIEYVATGVTAR